MRRDYERYWRDGVTFDELLLWLGQPIAAQPANELSDGNVVARAMSSDCSAPSPMTSPDAAWDCMKFEPAFREIMQQRRYDAFDRLYSKALGHAPSVLHLLTQCRAARIGELWVVRTQCMKHTIEAIKVMRSP